MSTANITRPDERENGNTERLHRQDGKRKHINRATTVRCDLNAICGLFIQHGATLYHIHVHRRMNGDA